jgi:hypothetical protein
MATKCNEKEEVPSSGFFQFCLPGDKFRSRKRANGASGARLAKQVVNDGIKRPTASRPA